MNILATNSVTATRHLVLLLSSTIVASCPSIHRAMCYLQRVDPGETEGLLDAVRQVGVVEDDVESEGLGAQRHR